MGRIKIQEETTKNPISLIGKEAGVCWGACTTDEKKNYKRGQDCLSANHGRTFEFPQVYLIVDGFSAKLVREFYTHIGSLPTRLQASTRYINYQNGFDYVIPPKISNDEEKMNIYRKTMYEIHHAMKTLDELGVTKEDSSMLLPLGMVSKFVVRTNLRHLIEMSYQRECTRAFWEYREFMKELKQALSEYSLEWKYIIDNYFKPKCEVCGYCAEKFSCGRKQKKDNK